MKKRIKLMADYGAFPLWDGENGTNLDPADLPLSAPLIEELNRWARRYHETLDVSDPPSSGFKSVEDEQSFERDGLCLWNQLRTELGGNVAVTYFSELDGRVLSQDEAEKRK